jgi:hypothetical protein
VVKKRVEKEGEKVYLLEFLELFEVMEMGL